MVAERKNSPSRGRPSTSKRTVCVKFPWATPAMARVTSVVGRSRSSIRVLTETSISPQAPFVWWKRIRSRVLPSLPTTWPARFNSCEICWLVETMSLKVSAIFPASPVHDPGKRTDKSPSRMVCKLARIAASSGDETWPLPPFPLVPLFSDVVSTSGGGIVALVFELDDLGLLRFMLFSRRWSALPALDKHSDHRDLKIRWLAPLWRTPYPTRRSLRWS